MNHEREGRWPGDDARPYLPTEIEPPYPPTEIEPPYPPLADARPYLPTEIEPPYPPRYEGVTYQPTHTGVGEPGTAWHVVHSEPRQADRPARPGRAGGSGTRTHQVRSRGSRHVAARHRAYSRAHLAHRPR